MVFKHLFQLTLLSVAFYLAISVDTFTKSNYETISISNLTGVFDIDFEKKIVHGDLYYTFSPEKEDDVIILDTNNLEIESIININEGNKLDYKFGNEDEIMGKPLIIQYGKNYSTENEFTINIKYSTKENGKSAQFLNKEQTIGKKEPFFFTVSKMILGRQLLPSQDTPAKKFPFYLGIKVPKKYLGLISGLFVGKEESDNDTIIYYYKQKYPVPNYLISLAAGNIIEKVISENISIYCEPDFIEKAAKVLEDLPEILDNVTIYLGDHIWERFNVLVLPNSFPYSAIENPYLAFCSQCLFDEDKSLVDIVINQLVHDWAGNLVTNENWSDYWISAGISTFIRRKITGMWKGVDYAKMDGVIGLVYIYGWTVYFMDIDSSYATLRPNYTGVNPDDYYSDIPIEKGFNLMYYIENLIGEDNMQAFLNQFFSENKFKSIDLEFFINFFNSFCDKKNILDKVKDLNWTAWIYEPGDCPVDNHLSNNEYYSEIQNVLEIFDNETIDEEVVDIVSNWNHLTKVDFMLILETRDQFLTDAQHDFLTNRLKFYEKQDFMVSANYFRMILSRTDKFYEHEMESLRRHLSTYGAFDYLAGTYEAFYKRDEVESQNIFNSLRNYYHPLFIAMVEDEFAFDKEYFPILKIGLEKEDKCVFLGDLNSKSKLNIKSEEYEQFLDVFAEYEIPEGVFLEIGNEKIKVNCTLNSKQKYCELEEGIEIDKSGEYILNTPNRIQKLDYAVKVHKSGMKIYIKKTEIDKDKTQKSFDIINETQNIDIFFTSEIDDKVRVLNKNKEIKCTKKGLVLECEIDRNSLDDGKNDFKIIDLCGDEKYSFVVNKSGESDENNEEDKGLKVWVIILIILAVILVLIVIFFVYRVLKRKKNPNIENSEEDTKIMPLE